ncbi:hypothetical protein Bhyg_13155 [Pseudolycoriella hygida]|uniref:Uncharacterized protein n=1 Tax=Pseudolycoriella hygida TaxID=35572 RepID=A0A9Q0MMU5_9DIPT|nr:hypothetical protein Bhyg_13155 [Pseudolycoriella hygida]
MHDVAGSTDNNISIPSFIVDASVASSSADQSKTSDGSSTQAIDPVPAVDAENIGRFQMDSNIRSKYDWLRRLREDLREKNIALQNFKGQLFQSRINFAITELQSILASGKRKSFTRTMLSTKQNALKRTLSETKTLRDLTSARNLAEHEDEEYFKHNSSIQVAIRKERRLKQLKEEHKY